MQRLDRLEEQNRALAAEVDALKGELAAVRGGSGASGASLEERVQVEETRTAEQAQSKVEASERFPIRITGMALFNAYLNSKNSGGPEYATTAAPGSPSGGATFRQTIIGFDYNGPTTLWNGKISGSLRMDFFGGSGQVLDQVFRLRTARLGIDWNDRGFMAGLDKPLISVREPESLAQVGISPLAGAGNLWLWIPQTRFEQDFHFGENSGVRTQIAAVETREVSGIYGYYGAPPPGAAYVEPARPGIETRLEFFTGTERRVEVAPGFHHSVSHAGDGSAPSTIYTADWLVRPIPAIEFTGSAFNGTNTAPLGGLQQGVVVLGPGRVRAVHSAGGWGQLTLRAGPRIWFNFFSGQEDARDSQLPRGAIGKNLAYGANAFFRLAPNVFTSLEVYQYRTSYIHSDTLLSNHYDLALAYRF